MIAPETRLPGTSRIVTIFILAGWLANRAQQGIRPRTALQDRVGLSFDEIGIAAMPIGPLAALRVV